MQHAYEMYIREEHCGKPGIVGPIVCLAPLSKKVRKALGTTLGFWQYHIVQVKTGHFFTIMLNVLVLRQLSCRVVYERSSCQLLASNWAPICASNIGFQTTACMSEPSCTIVLWLLQFNLLWEEVCDHLFWDGVSTDVPYPQSSTLAIGTNEEGDDRMSSGALTLYPCSSN